VQGTIAQLTSMLYIATMALERCTARGYIEARRMHDELGQLMQSYRTAVRLTDKAHREWTTRRWPSARWWLLVTRSSHIPYPRLLTWVGNMAGIWLEKPRSQCYQHKPFLQDLRHRRGANIETESTRLRLGKIASISFCLHQRIFSLISDNDNLLRRFPVLQLWSSR